VSRIIILLWCHPALKRVKRRFFPRNDRNEQLSLLNVQDDTFVNRIFSDATETFKHSLLLKCCQCCTIQLVLHNRSTTPTIPLFALIKGYRSKRQLSKSFTVAIRPQLGHQIYSIFKFYLWRSRLSRQQIRLRHLAHFKCDVRTCEPKPWAYFCEPSRCFSGFLFAFLI